MLEKVTSAAVIIYNPILREILVEHPTGRIFKNKDGTAATGVFSLPKGIIEKDEDPVVTAVREIKEETDIDLNIKKLHYVGKYKYIKYKDLEIFYYLAGENEIDIKKCKCNSFFNGPNGKKLPEVNGFAWISIDKDLHFLFKSQQIILQDIIKNYSEYFE